MKFVLGVFTLMIALPAQAEIYYCRNGALKDRFGQQIDQFATQEECMSARRDAMDIGYYCKYTSLREAITGRQLEFYASADECTQALDQFRE